EIAGAALALRQHMTLIHTQRSGLLDTCGTGGVGSTLFNISTSAAIVAAAAGVSVAKHGNRSITSKSGSADVLAALGVNIDAPPATVERCLDELGLCFCFAPKQHPAMRHVSAVRKQLGVPTIFNLLGPLCNPAGAPFQLMGVGRPERHAIMAEVLALLGTQRAIVVTGNDGLGEITLSTSTQVTEVRDGQLRSFVWQPSDFGLQPAEATTLLVDGPAASAAKVQAVLAGESGPPRDIVLLNAAAALWTAGHGSDLIACAQAAATAIDSGAARDLLAKLVTLSHR
ncbi:MAG TPA: anthranilate phosphoribosyltransferase, partial [Pirellulaceae bacterium]|nr:anthranilate phosphoribosyltransferase [Pirellulaceae bacterium]